MDFLVPIEFAKKPNIKVPHIPPIGSTDPIQPASSFVSSPLMSGEAGDSRIGSDGDNHPIAQPCERHIKVAASTIITKYYYKSFLLLCYCAKIIPPLLQFILKGAFLEV